MMRRYNIENIQLPKGVFTRSELLLAASLQDGFRETQMRHLLESLLQSGRITRVGRGRYIAGPAKPVYSGSYSKRALEIASTLERENPWASLRVWELVWLNEFMNHQIVRNCIFVETERASVEFVFDEVDQRWHGETLLLPSVDEVIRYGTNDTIVVKGLFSDPPPARPESYRVGLEKMVVDMFAEKLVRGLLPRGDYPMALNDMFSRYSVDQVSMMRYARRRGKADEVRRFLIDKASVVLYG